MSTNQMRKIGSNLIGCNLVDPLLDTTERYTEQAYTGLLSKYLELGIRAVEFSHVTILDIDSARRIQDHCVSIGIEPWSIHSEHLNAVNESGIYEKALDEYLEIQKHCAAVAEALGTKVMVCHIPNVEPRAADPERDIRVLSMLADITRKHNLILAVETPPYDYLIKIVDEINRPDVGINIDTGHSFLEGNNPAMVAETVGNRLVTLHLQDNFGENDDHQPPGLGRIDWRSTLSAIKNTGYQGPLMLEMTGPGVKSHRTVEQLRDFDLEKEIIFAKNYLEHIWGTL